MYRWCERVQHFAWVDRLTKIIVDILSKGDEWPQEEIVALQEWLGSRGYTEIASGSGTNASTGGKMWWAAKYERKLDDEATEADLDSSTEITDPDPVP